MYVICSSITYVEAQEGLRGVEHDAEQHVPAGRRAAWEPRGLGVQGCGASGFGV